MFHRSLARGQRRTGSRATHGWGLTPDSLETGYVKTTLAAPAGRLATQDRWPRITVATRPSPLSNVLARIGSPQCSRPPRRSPGVRARRGARWGSCGRPVGHIRGRAFIVRPRRHRRLRRGRSGDPAPRHQPARPPTLRPNPKDSTVARNAVQYEVVSRQWHRARIVVEQCEEFVGQIAHVVAGRRQAACSPHQRLPARSRDVAGCGRSVGRHRARRRAGAGPRRSSDPSRPQWAGGHRTG